MTKARGIFSRSKKKALGSAWAKNSSQCGCHSDRRGRDEKNRDFGMYAKETEEDVRRE